MFLSTVSVHALSGARQSGSKKQRFKGLNVITDINACVLPCYPDTTLTSSLGGHLRHRVWIRHDLLRSTGKTGHRKDLKNRAGRVTTT